MATSYYLGLPGSGKTYLAMHTLYTNFVDTETTKLDKYLIKIGLKKPKEIKYEIAYTNINEFNFSVSDKIKPLDWQQFYFKLQNLHNLYLQKKTDSELIEFAKKENIFKALIVVDEIHNIFNKKDDEVIIFWLTYHRHFSQDIILITQDLSLVNKEYKTCAEFFYRAIPSRFRLSKNTFKYRQYSSYSLYAKDIVPGGDVKVKANPKIFSLYHSGAKAQQKSIFHKYFLLLFLIVAYFIYSLQNFFSVYSNNDATTTKPNDTMIVENNSVPVVLPGVEEKEEKKDNLKLFKFNCFKTMCYYKMPNNELFEVPESIFKFYLKDIEKENKYFELKNNKLLIYVLVDSNRFNFIPQGEKEDEKINNQGIINMPGVQ